MKRKTKNRGFTLIEMLVVVAVILVLAAMLVPALSSARESGRSAKCSSNLHQLQLAALSYASDHGGSMPGPACSWAQDEWGVWTHGHGWVSWSVYSFCTNDVTHANGAYAWSGVAGKACVTNGALYPYVKGGEGVYLCPTFALKTNCKVNDPWRSYSMNTGVSSYSLLGGVGQVDAVLFGDDSGLVAIPAADAQFTTNSLARWHNGKAIVVYADGHIDKL